MKDYAQMVHDLTKSGAEIQETLTPEKCHLLHMAFGIAGEAGELLDAVKKHVIYDKDLDVGNVIEEMGDLEFYQEGLRQALGLLRSVVLAANVTKLSKRYYLGSYSNEQAQTRADKEVGQ